MAYCNIDQQMQLNCLLACCQCRKSLTVPGEKPRTCWKNEEESITIIPNNEDVILSTDKEISARLHILWKLLFYCWLPSDVACTSTSPHDDRTMTRFVLINKHDDASTSIVQHMVADRVEIQLVLLWSYILDLTYLEKSCRIWGCSCNNQGGQFTKWRDDAMFLFLRYIYISALVS